MCVKSQTIQMGLQRRNMTNHLTRVALRHACRETEWMVFASVDHMSNNTSDWSSENLQGRNVSFQNLHAECRLSHHHILKVIKMAAFHLFEGFFFRLFSWSEISGKQKLDLQFFKNRWSIHLFTVKANKIIINNISFYTVNKRMKANSK